MDLASTPWFVTRSAAIASFSLLFLMIVMGETMASGKLYDFIAPPRAWLMHKYLGVSFGLAVLTHLVSLLFDNFLPMNIWNVLVPFHESVYRPFPVALGIIGFYLIAIILISSLISRFQHSVWWKKLHFLTYLLFVMGLFHGFLAGTDSLNWFMLFFYGVTGMIFCWLLVQRFQLARTRR